MKILIIGSGGREHALAAVYAKSHRVKKVFVSPGNDFMEETSSKIQVFPHNALLDFASHLSLAKKMDVDLVDVAQDNVLAEGFIDKFSKYGIPVFGPKKSAAEIEWNKNWARKFMKKYHLPIPRFEAFREKSRAFSYIDSLPEQLLFIKASGLAFGKGVIRAETKEEAKAAVAQMQQFGSSGKTFLIEEGMIGEEFSLFAICDGKRYVFAGTAQDHKTVYDGDTGPNTGGMGCVSPMSRINRQTLSEIKKSILTPFIHGMLLEERPYSGILYLGGMITNPPTGGGYLPAGRQVQVVEFNSRWGEPEANVLLPGFKTDYVAIVEAVMMQELMTTPVQLDNKIRISIAGCAKGYPLAYGAVKGKKIYGLKKVMQLPGITVFGAGIKKEGNHYVVNGGRVFHLVAEGDTIAQARERAYAAMTHLSIEGNNLHYRTDIGWKEVERQKV